MVERIPLMWTMSQFRVGRDVVSSDTGPLASPIRVLGFFHALAEADESTAEWDALVGGLAAIRLAEAALSNGQTLEVPATRVDAFVARVSDTSTRGLLTSIVDATRAPHAPDDYMWRHVLAGRLMAYGMGLHASGRFAPAVDVFRTIERADLFDTEFTMQAIYQRAFALRVLHRFDEATAAYAALRTAAREFRHRRFELEADLGDAKIAADRGNLPNAERMVDDVLHRCDRVKDRQLRGKALIDRAWIAGLRKQPDRSLAFSLMALREVEESQRRDRICNNIAFALRETGNGELAKRTAMIVAAHGEHADQRTLAEILLYNLAVDEQAWPVADAFRHRLGRATMTPQRAAEYYQAEARHLAAVGDVPSAERVLARMLAVAQEHRLGQLANDAEEALTDLRRGLVPRLYEYRPTMRVGAADLLALGDVDRAIAAAYA